jgi:hypothetical protein
MKVFDVFAIGYNLILYCLLVVFFIYFLYKSIEKSIGFHVNKKSEVYSSTSRP